MDKWAKAQEWELDWHGDCLNSIGEELKQLVYAQYMGLSRTPNNKTPYSFDLKEKTVLDIGGGAYSLLLKCENKGLCYVADPLMDKYPQWVLMRYLYAGIAPLGIAGENLLDTSEFNDGQTVDEIWIYNVLQHVKDPGKIISNARKISKVIRLFEWVDTGTNIGHLHSLKEDKLNKWLGGEGVVRGVNQNGTVGKAYFGVFKENHYE